MATSSSTNFNQTRDNIISDALSLLGILRKGGTAGSDEISFASNILNKMIKAWQASGVNLWSEDEGVLFLTNDKNTYTLSATGDKASNENIKTELSAAGGASATTITVDSVTDMATSDNIGVELDDNTIHWTTISAINTTTKVITLAAGLASAAAVDNNVYVYTTILNRPRDILQVRYKYDDGKERELRSLGRNEYFALPDKDTNAPPTAYYFSPQLNSGKLYLWPTPDDVSDRILFTYIRTLEDFDAAGDNPDLPQEWLETLTYNLAVRLAPSYQINLARAYPDLILLATTSFQTLQLADSESSSVFMIPNYDLT